ncbi:hypothetical protein ACFVHW_04055 [Streptomyces sp. NPDC127110]|uniref:hypothetical protein n=1 Tax=Streptomyces sp. NPDC127110 TaxID=3345362 RepID=UPI003643CAC5
MEHSRAAERTGLPVRTPQEALKRRRALTDLGRAPVNLFAAAGDERLPASGTAEAGLPHSGGTA